MNIIITGGCGFVGSALSIFLKKNLKNSKILSIDNLSKSYSKFNQAILNKNKIKNENKYFGRDEYFNSVIVESNRDVTGKILEVKINQCNRNTLFGDVILNKDYKKMLKEEKLLYQSVISKIK